MSLDGFRKMLCTAVLAGTVGMSACGSAAGGTPTSPTTPTAPGPSGGTTPGAAPLVTVDASKTLSTISPTILGANMAIWFDVTQSGVAASLKSAGFKSVRWPGGSDADEYHWANHTTCDNAYRNPNSTFDTFMTIVAQPAGLDVALTVNYGTNAACTGGGDPNEAADWVDYANNAKKYGVKWWTVGNENYGSWEADLHTARNDAATYAAAVKNGYYPAMKAKDASALIGVVTEPPSSWDRTVLANASYDFVEMHYYAQAPGQESDSALIFGGAKALSAQVASLKNEMAAAGKTVPIYVGELGSVYTNPGKQSSSITQALFAGQVVGELVNAGVSRATWWLGYGGCSTSTGGGNFSSSLYGWQTYGGYNLLGDGGGCGAALGTVLPTARAYQLAALFAHGGERVFPVTVATSLPRVRAYGASQGSGYAVMLFNLDRDSSATVPVGISAISSGRSVAITTYGKAEYDQSKTGTWAAPAVSSLGAWSTSFPVTLPPWSMVVAIVTP